MLCKDGGLQGVPDERASNRAEENLCWAHAMRAATQIYPGIAAGRRRWPGRLGFVDHGIGAGQKPDAGVRHRIFLEHGFREAGLELIATRMSATSPKTADAKLAKTLNATDPNLSAFKARGGKLILYHGWNDPAISAINTLNYYQSVVDVMGQDGVDSFARVYMAPGMQHCAGGVGPDSFGENGPWPSLKDPHQSLQLSLEEWVEKGTRAERSSWRRNFPGR